MAGSCLWLDVNVVHSTSTSSLNRAPISGQSHLAAVDARYKSKVSHFKSATDDAHAVFRPLVFSSYGAVDEAVVKVVDAISKQVEEVPGLREREDFKSKFFTDCSLALQLGNAQIARVGFDLAFDEFVNE